MNDQEKSKMGTKTFVSFCQQFGEDVYSQILLEELFKGLIHEETLFVFGEPIQGGGEAGDSSTERICDKVEVDGFIDSESSDCLGTPDLSDYP